MTFALQESARATSIRVGASRVGSHVPGVDIGDEIQARKIDGLSRRVFIGVVVARQITFELDPIHSLDASRLVGIDKEMLLGISNVIENEALRSRIFECLIELQTD